MKYPLYMAKKSVESTINNTLLKLKYNCEIKIEIPPNELGDFAFPCFNLSPILKKSPNDISLEISKQIQKDKWIKKVEAKGGYVNFYLDFELLKKSTFKVLFDNKVEYGTLEKKNKKVIVEHTSANPNGPLHIGRARNPIIGDTITRIFKAAGYNVESQFYLDDMGKQVAILAWGVNNLKEKDIPKCESEKQDHKTVGYYQTASALMKEKSKVSEEISKIVKLSEEGDKKTLDMVHKAYTPVLDGIKESMKRINIEIDSYIPESNFIENKNVDDVIKKLKKLENCKDEDGALYIDLEPFGIKGRNTKFFFLRSDGTTLYATRDIAYHIWKANQADILINVLGEDHKLESKQVEIALNLLKEKKTPKVIFYSFVSLPGGKMSTRHGRVVYLDDLIQESISQAYAEVKKRRKEELSEKEMKKIAEIVGIAALRFNIIKVQPEKDIVFKWEEALNFEGLSAPFIQYAHARTCGILSKTNFENKTFDSLYLTHDSEVKLIKTIAKFPLIIDEACEGFRPHIITSYLFELASFFNQFYRDCPVISEENKDIRNARIGLVEATKTVLCNGLNLLGITAPKEM
ncbi:MAG: arginine--tRNA ligase [Euryarchaeota archaeon RBG_13_31_8]|nr:MAG: arginine--tRNA ligase [Euryarchaeota archaeon RBG_13_31_8]